MANNLCMQDTGTNSEQALNLYMLFAGYLYVNSHRLELRVRLPLAVGEIIH